MPGREDWTPDGYVAYSKLCTHLGCPVGLYEQELELLVCPCHQSMFNVRNGAVPQFGPAPRPLPQMHLGYNDEGYLIAHGALRSGRRARLLGADHMSDTAAKTKRSTRAAMGPYGQVGKIVDELDDRLGVAKGGRVFLDKIFPDHWSFMLGEIALYSFVVLLATGVFLSLFFVPSTQPGPLRHGTYVPLRGQWVSEAYKSTVDISFDVRGGLLVRQMHHWAADIFTASIVVHMGRIFFTGAFRKPRELNWTIGLTMLILAIFEGFIGYSLPDDLISGTGLRIGYSIAESIPLVGSYLVSFLWGGHFPGDIIIPRFFIIHVLIIPLVLIGLLSAHLGLLVRQKHTQFAGEGRTEDNVVGSPMFPTFMAKTTGFLFMVTAATALLGAFAQINPIWQFGSYDASKISYAVQPDWYMGWLDGALRIMPSWELAGFGPYHPPRGLPARRGLPRPHLHHLLLVAGDRETGDRRRRDAQPARPAARQAQAHGRRRGHVRPPVHALRGELDRRPGQLLPRLAQRRPVVLPHRRVRDPDRRRPGRPTSCAGRCRACTASASASGR